MTVELLLQDAVANFLFADPGVVSAFGASPCEVLSARQDNPPLPRLQVAASVVNDVSVQGVRRVDVELMVDAFTRDADDARVMALGGAVRLALTSDEHGQTPALGVAGWRANWARAERQSYRRDRQKSLEHSQSVFTIRLQPTA